MFKNAKKKIIIIIWEINKKKLLNEINVACYLFCDTKIRQFSFFIFLFYELQNLLFLTDTKSFKPLNIGHFLNLWIDLGS